MTNQTDPFILFDQWYKEAEQHKKIKEVNAVSLATATKEGIPSNRMVLLKDYNEQGFVFYTNLESRKGNELKSNPKAAMCIYWEPIGKQIRIEGDIVQVSDEEADMYFATRNLKSRIGAWASKQSHPLESSGYLIKQVAEQTAKMATGKVERPPFWSGFRLLPTRIEFWQKGEFRIHDRISYQLQDGQWHNQLLYP